MVLRNGIGAPGDQGLGAKPDLLWGWRGGPAPFPVTRVASMPLY